MRIEKRKISELIRAEYNPRKISVVQLQELKDGIEEFGLVSPLVVNEHPERKNIIVGGHQRLKLWEELGNKEVDCSIVNLPLDKERKLNIKLNKNGGTFDDDLLKEFFDYEELIEWGFTVSELFDMDETEIKGNIEDDEIPEVKESKVKRGDIWQLGEHRIMCGDSTSSDDVAKLMNGEKADMVFTDPPYNLSFKGSMSNTTKDGVMIKHKGANQKHNEINNDRMSKDDFYNFILDMLKEIKTNCKGAFYICFGSQTLNQLLQPFLNLGMEYKSIIIWKKNQATLSGKDYKGRYEPIVYGRFNDDFFGKRFNEEDIWEYQRTLKNDLHPTMKPIPLIENAIKNSSKLNMLVLDLFLGSGSTLIAAEKLKRKCYGMELDEKYCDVIIERWEQFTGNKAEKING
tara:strand:+ start:231 stop:1436 length:1206 start_codon:yes stop_codon:yes gene_type:complete